MLSSKKKVALLPYISAMYQLGIISSFEKNELCRALSISESYFEIKLFEFVSQRNTAGYYDKIIDILEQ